MGLNNQSLLLKLNSPKPPFTKMGLGNVFTVSFICSKLEWTLNTLVCMIRPSFFHMFMQDFIDFKHFSTMYALIGSWS